MSSCNINLTCDSEVKHLYIRSLNFQAIKILVFLTIRPDLMLPSTSSGPGYCAVNAFHLAQGQQPPNLQPDSHYTYGELETLRQVQTDVNQNLCVPSRIHTWAVWIEPMPIANTPDSDSSSPEPFAGTPGDDLAMDAGSTTEDVRPDMSAVAGETTEADGVASDADHAPVVPPHPSQALFDLALTHHQLPAPQQQEFQDGLALALAKATEVHTLTGLPEEEALNAARSAAWTFIRDMCPLDLRRAKRQRFLPHTEEEAGHPRASSSGRY